MKNRLIAALMMATSLCSWNAMAVNPHVLEAKLNIDGVFPDSAEFDPGPGGFVAKNGWKKITLGYEGVPLRMRLNWESDKIAVYLTTNSPAPIDNPTFWDVENGEIMPTNLWVKGLEVSETGPTDSTCGPEHICLEAINNGTSYVTPFYDRVGFTVYTVDKIIVTPKGVSSDTTLPDPVRIGVGAIETPVHQADVEIQVTPQADGIPVDINLVGGRGHTSDKDAKLEMDSLTAYGDGATVTVPTDADGKITGVLTSCDVLDSACTIHACTNDADVVFTWIWRDGFDISTDWLLDPEFLPISGVVTNRLRLRHHYMEETNALWAPFDQHEVRFFVEEVQWEDDNGISGVIINTAEDPSDEVNDWAYFDGPVTTDDDGIATSKLVVLGNPWLKQLKVVAYDWVVFNEPAPVPDNQQTTAANSPKNTGLNALATENRTTAVGDGRSERPNVGTEQGPIRPIIALAPTYIPVVATNLPVAGTQFAGDLWIYIANLPETGWPMVFQVSNTTTRAWEPAGDNLIKAVANPVAVFQCDDITFFDGAENYNRYHAVKIAAFRKGDYRIIITGPANSCCFTNQFTAIEGHFSFSGNTQPIRVNTNQTDYAIFPLYNPTITSLPRVNLAVQGCLTGTPESAAYTLLGMETLSAGSAFQFQPSSGLTCALSATSENDATLSGIFHLKADYKKVKISITEEGTPPSMFTTRSTISLARKGSLSPLQLVCPDVSIVHPSGQRPPDGEDGARVQNNDALFVFDSAAFPGKCPITNETTKLPALSSIAKTLVWQNLEWVQPDIANVTRVGPNAVTDEPWKTSFSYEQMPLHNDAFGNANLTLRFRARTQWAWNQPIQFRFNRTGTSAAARVAPTMPTYVQVGNPNWYVYWQQVANQFTFGSQASSMFYDDRMVGPDGEWGSWRPFSLTPWVDIVMLFQTNKNWIVDCVTTIHHENGHRQSHQLPPNKGGFGEGLTWSFGSDRDGDLVNDLWETNVVGSALGFTINVETYEDEYRWRGNWDHGWATTSSVKNPPAAPYCNPYPDGYSETQGYGLCPRNEYNVRVRENEIKLKDWSHCPSP